MENLSFKKTFEQNYFGDQRVKGVKNDLVPPPAINSPGYDKVFHDRVSCRSRTFYKFFKQHLRWQFFKRLSTKMRHPLSPTVRRKCHLHFILRLFTVCRAWPSRFHSRTRQRLKNPSDFPMFRMKATPFFFQVIVSRFKNLVFEVRALLNRVRGKEGVKRNGE